MKFYNSDEVSGNNRLKIILESAGFKQIENNPSRITKDSLLLLDVILSSIKEVEMTLYVSK